MFTEYIKYLKDNPNHYWFKRKLYGWGWVPATWQGWMVIFVYSLAVTLFALTIDPNSPPKQLALTFILPTLLLTTALITTCYKKGEKPMWQWGVDKREK